MLICYSRIVILATTRVTTSQLIVIPNPWFEDRRSARGGAHVGTRRYTNDQRSEIITDLQVKSSESIIKVLLDAHHDIIITYELPGIQLV